MIEANLHCAIALRVKSPPPPSTGTTGGPTRGGSGTRSSISISIIRDGGGNAFSNAARQGRGGRWRVVRQCLRGDGGDS